MNTAVKWLTVEEVMDFLDLRNKQMRIINDAVHNRIKGSDPIYAWNGEECKYVYVRRKDWVRASPAIRITEACVILRITPKMFRSHRNATGVRTKRSVVGRVDKPLPKRFPYVYYSIEDLMTISRDIAYRKGQDPAGDAELRELFSKGYTTYKKTKDGRFVPVWEETIY
jgi:hypothetical protein